MYEAYWAVSWLGLLCHIVSKTIFIIIIMSNNLKIGTGHYSLYNYYYVSLH